MRVPKPEGGQRWTATQIKRRDILRFIGVGAFSSVVSRALAQTKPSQKRLSAVHATRERSVLMQTPLFSGATSTYTLSGTVADQIQGVIDHWLLVAPTHNPAMLSMFENRDKQSPRDLLTWSGEFAGKYLTACAQLLRLTRNPVLRASTQKFVDRLVTLQMEDGYLGPWAKPYRLTATPSIENWDAWGQGCDLNSLFSN